MNKIVMLASAAALALTASHVTAQRASKLSDPRVRQAIAYAIDMDTIVETLFEGKAIVADSMIPNGGFKAEGLNAYAYDPDKARQLLQEAGWDGNQTLDVVYYYGDQMTVDLMVVLQAYLADVGIDMTYRRLEGDVGAQLNMLPEEGSDTSAVTWDIAYGAKAALALQEYYNGYRSGRSSYSPGSSKRDELVDAINASADPAVQKKAFEEFERFENEALSDIPLYYQQLFIYENERMSRNGGEYGNDQFNYDWNIVNWTVEPNENGKEVLYTNNAPAQFFEHPWLNPGIYVFSKIGLDRLLTADGSLTPKGGQLASDYSVSDDGLSVSFALKDGLTWHDGDDLTAEDVVWSVETAQKLPGTINAVFKATFDSIESISADGNVVNLTMKRLDPNVLLTFSQFPPLPMHLLDGVNPAEFQQHPFWQNPVGSGPYKIAEVQMNDFVRFVPFENYHGAVANIDEIVAFPSGENDANVIKNAEAGRLDFGFTKSVGDVKALEAMTHMRVVPANIPYTRSLRVNGFEKIAEN